MKKRSLFILISATFAGSLFSQIPNNGFENWTDMGSYSTPDEWGNLNAVTNPAGVYTCLKGTPGYPGTAYIKLTSRTVSGMGVQPGIAVSGVLNTTTFQEISGFSYASRPESLDGNWQYMAGGADQGFIAAYLTKWNTVSNSRDTIGLVNYPLPGMVMSWRGFSLPLTYSSSEIPDTAMIILSASGKSPVSGSYLSIDNLAFAGGTVGLEEMPGSSGLSLFPNPVTKNRLTVQLTKKDFTAETIDILDLHGNLLVSKNMTALYFPVSVDLSGIQAGEYILRISSGGNLYSRKFIKQ
ncbi:MAG: T9SS type A sorting domain-containing protein [Bacteroidetes bacterium]|nr:T9SS type A sorting domain-containing protein [Bacteroidota bacterium]